jgi:hypothetical protein
MSIRAGRRALLRKAIVRSRAHRNSRWVATLSMLVPRFGSLTDVDSRMLLAKSRAAA